MKFSSILFVALFAFLANQQAYAQSGGSCAAEAQSRRDSCDDLVKPHPPSASSSQSTSAATTTTQSPASGASSTTTTKALLTSQGVCTCTCDESSSTPVANSAATEGGESASSSSPAAVTNGVSSATSGGQLVECDLTDYFYNISVLLTGEEYDIFIEWIQEIQVTILVDVSLSYDQMVVEIAYSLKAFFSEHVEIQEVLYYEQLGSWGLVIDFIYVAYQIQIEITQNIVTLDASGDCALFDALRNGTAGNSEQAAAVEELIANITIILETSYWTYSQQQAQIYLIFEQFFVQYSSWESSFLSIQIEGYGILQYYIDVAFWYEQIVTISVVIGGDVSDCVLLQALLEASQNTSFSSTVQNEFQQLYEQIQTYFESTTDIEERLNYVATECFSFFELVGYMEVYVDQVSCGSWGYIYDIIFCSDICVNCGCGNPDNGPGTESPSSEASTVEASSSASEASSSSASDASSSPAPEASSSSAPEASSSPAPEASSSSAPEASSSSAPEASSSSAPEASSSTVPAESTAAEVTSPSTGATTPSTKVTTPSTKATTATVSTSTVKPADCSNRWAQLQIQSSSNSTHFTDCVGDAYATWNATTRASFNTYWNQIRTAIWNTTLSDAKILKKVVTSCSNFNSNNVHKQQILYNVTITQWYGTVGQFVACGKTL